MSTQPTYHRIRLHGPWRLQAAGDETAVSVPLTLEPKRPGQTICRRFGKPTGLEPDQPVWLVVLHDASELVVRLNQTELTTSAALANGTRTRIDRLLQPSNLLELSFSPGSDAEIRLDSVYLEIES